MVFLDQVGGWADAAGRRLPVDRNGAAHDPRFATGPGAVVERIVGHPS
ncbi:hypothetical protein [Methylobacterium nodulans]|nr:hypothetical protein [Methylobacterium nodulans]